MSSAKINARQIQRLSDSIGDNISTLAGKQSSLAGELRTLQQENQELLNSLKPDLPLAQERALRLQQLCNSLYHENKRLANRYQFASRQLEKLQDSVADKYLFDFQKRMKKLCAGSSSLKRSSERSILLYELGGVIFGVKGKVLRIKKPFNPKIEKKFKYNGKELECFPAAVSHFITPGSTLLGLLVVPHGASFLGLWYNQLVGVHSDKEWSFAAPQLKPCNFNRFIKNRYNYRGLSVNLLTTDK